MKVVKADYAGACYGVQRALDIASETLKRVECAYTLGPLIHNPQTVMDLERRGAKVADDISQIGNGTVIIRSHGVMPDVYERLYDAGADVVDATCPHVARAQKAAAELGRRGMHVLVVGEAGHPEVMGLCEYARKEGATVRVVQSGSDIPDDFSGPVGVVVQTTQTREALDDVLKELTARGIHPEVKNTICSATSRRQKTAADVASKVDAMVVIGGRNSSNTTRLYEICQARCARAFHIESSEELTPAMFIGCSSVGIAAGASTPKEQIRSVLEVIEDYPASIDGAALVRVKPESAAYEAGFEPGCVITSVNGRPLTDILVWQWESADDEIEVEYIDLDGEVGKAHLFRECGQDWGFEFEGAIFDSIHTCCNACTFCFMRQLPQGLRPALKLRDDDFRLSFLTGTFVTLTNLSAQDERRIIEERISPLRVSLHAADPEIRGALMGAHAQAGLDALSRLLAAGIEFDAQIVLVPGVNDGDVLRQTLEWAYERPGIVNVGIVPLGFTKYQTRFMESFDEPSQAKAVLDLIEPFCRRAERERGRTWVFAADEFYRNAYMEDIMQHLPPASFYKDCEMYEDGIGIIRSCADELAEACNTGLAQATQEALKQADMLALNIVGEIMRPYYGKLLKASELSLLRPLIVQNAFFGGNVNVTGLLCGCDICSAIKGDMLRDATEANSDSSGAAEARDMHTLSTAYLIPSVVFNADGLTLDGMTLDDIRRETAAQVHLVSSNPLDCLQQVIKIANGEGAF